MRYVVVIPSIRSVTRQYIEVLLQSREVTKIFVIDDAEGAVTCKDVPNGEVIDWPEKVQVFRADRAVETIRERLSEFPPHDASIWARKNPSCKNLGLFLAYHEPECDAVILLDDDCFVGDGYIDKIPLGRRVVARWQPGRLWVNTLSLLSDNALWARGVPYHERDIQPFLSEDADTVIPKFNEGLWFGWPDINGMDKLLREGEGVVGEDRYLLNPGTWLWVRESQRLPLSIMNVQLTRELIPAFYQPPDWQVGSEGFLVRRHDDVWSAMILKAVMDTMGHHMTAGGPLIRHIKEGNAVREALSEHTTNLIQPYLEQVVVEASNSVRWVDVPYNYAARAVELGLSMGSLAPRMAPPAYARVIVDYAHRIVRWARLF